MTDSNHAVISADAAHYAIVGDVFLETHRQLELWGVQDHLMGTGPEKRLLSRTDVNLDLRTGAELEHIFRNKVVRLFGEENGGTYFDVLLEEVFEAGAEDDPEKLETELIQVAAVAVSMVAASRRARGA